MKVLLDSCISGRAKGELETSGHDVAWCGDWARDPGDEEILRTAHAEGRVLVTLDKDFGELVVVRGQLHSGIIRLVGFRVDAQGRAVAEILGRYGIELAEGGLVTARPTRVRIRPRERDSEE